MCLCSDPMTDMDIQELANLTAGDADVENFERLFTKLKEMKGITCLPSLASRKAPLSRQPNSGSTVKKS